MAKRQPSTKPVDGEKIVFPNGGEIHMSTVNDPDKFVGLSPGLPATADGPTVEEARALQKGEELPEVTTFGIVKTKGKFAAVKITTKAKRVTEIKYGEVQQFNFAMDEMKLWMVDEYDRYFSGKE